jgi:serine/threonine protein kinase
MVPEIGNQIKNDAKTDIWALAITFYEMVTYIVPFIPGDDSNEIVILLNYS